MIAFSYLTHCKERYWWIHPWLILTVLQYGRSGPTFGLGQLPKWVQNQINNAKHAKKYWETLNSWKTNDQDALKCEQTVLVTKCGSCSFLSYFPLGIIICWLLKIFWQEHFYLKFSVWWASVVSIVHVGPILFHSSNQIIHSRSFATMTQHTQSHTTSILSACPQVRLNLYSFSPYDFKLYGQILWKVLINLL